MAVRLGGLLIALGALTALLGHQLLGTSSSAALAPSSSTAGSPIGLPTSMDLPDREKQPEPRDSGGEVADGVTVFSDEEPAVTRLSADLLDALRRAASEAETDGVEFIVNSGWRSAAYQDQLLRDAISQYGSEKEAARWVATSKTSAHVAGDAVDIGPWKAAAWLSRNGADYGLCQIYRNEPWHYELRPDAVDDGCPQMYADPTEDPRMQH